MKYEIVMYWSDEDEAFICEVLELGSCMAATHTCWFFTALKL